MIFLFMYLCTLYVRIKCGICCVMYIISVCLCKVLIILLVVISCQHILPVLTLNLSSLGVRVPFAPGEALLSVCNSQTETYLGILLLNLLLARTVSV